MEIHEPGQHLRCHPVLLIHAPCTNQSAPVVLGVVTIDWKISAAREIFHGSWIDWIDSMKEMESRPGTGPANG